MFALAWHAGITHVLTRTCYARFQDLMESLPRYLTADEAEELTSAGWNALRFHNAAACEASTQGVLSWLMQPKAHTMCHLLDDAMHERYNPRFYHNFEGENAIGSLKPLCMRCLGPGMERRVLKRVVLKMVTEKEDDVARMHR